MAAKKNRFDIEAYLTRERRQLIDANAHRKVRTIARQDDTPVADIVFDIASGGAEHTIRNWLDVLAELDQNCELLDAWIERRITELKGVQS